VDDSFEIRQQPISAERRQLVRELERLIGGEIYNPRIQNRGPGGGLISEGRQIQYPLTVVNDLSEKSKLPNGLDRNATEEEVRGAYYAFGSNHLHIGMGLLKAIRHLERHYGLVVDKASREE